MKKTIGLLLVFGFCLFISPCMAQEDYVQEKFEGYYKELVDFDKKIDSTNFELYENRFETNKKFADACFNEYIELIDNDKSLTKLYGKYKELQTSLDKRMKDLKKEKEKQEEIEKVSTKLQRYQNQLKTMEEIGKLYIENTSVDSLESMKKDAAVCYQKAFGDYSANREIIDENDDLSILWGDIEETNKRISEMSIIIPAGFFDKITGDDIFKICIGLVALILGYTTISSKIKMNKLQNPKIPKLPKKDNKKKDEDIPAI